MALIRRSDLHVGATLLLLLCPALLDADTIKASLLSPALPFKWNDAPCTDPCQVTLVESIPENLTYAAGSPAHPSVFSSWQYLLSIARESIDIASSYWTLRNTFVSDPTDWQGAAIYKGLLEAGTKRGIKIRIAETKPSKSQPSQDTIDLQKAGAAEVRSLDMERLVGAGILHTKMWLVDNRHFYLGSANLDWRSLTQVKELGGVTYNCSCLGEDMRKIFETYWYLGTSDSTIPDPWPANYSTDFGFSNPMQLTYNDSDSANVYLAASPPQLCSAGRTSDIHAILDIIAKAQQFICIAVMDYFPTSLYQKHNTYWPLIDDALRAAAFDRKVTVKVMGSWWKHSRPGIANFLRSLQAINGSDWGVIVEAKLFKVPCFNDRQCKIPFARVNHNKYMVTDQVAYIGTSNWSEDYFASTGGIGYVVNETNSAHPVRHELYEVFKRDWTSQYAQYV